MEAAKKTEPAEIIRIQFVINCRRIVTESKTGKSGYVQNLHKMRSE